MSYTKEQQAGRKKKEPTYRIPQMGEGAKEMAKAIKEAYHIIHETRPHNCEETGSPEWEHSHCFPQKAFKWLAATPENIVLLNRAQHILWEDCHLQWLPNTAKRSIEWMFHAIEHETDIKRRRMMSEHIWNKLHKCADRCMEAGTEVPEWVRKYLE